MRKLPGKPMPSNGMKGHGLDESTLDRDAYKDVLWALTSREKMIPKTRIQQVGRARQSAPDQFLELVFNVELVSKGTASTACGKAMIWGGAALFSAAIKAFL
jgi:hypothetical protein